MYTKEFVQYILKLNPTYKGKDIKIAVIEGRAGASDNSSKIYDGVFMANTEGSKITHDDEIGSVIKQFKPESKVYLLPNSDFDKVEGLSVSEWIIENDIDIVSMSQSKSLLPIEEQNKIAKHCFIITAAGNRDELGETLDEEDDLYWWQVGAIRYNKPGYFRDKNGKWQKFSYSSWGRDEVDGATLSEIEHEYGTLGGTSGAAPLYAVQIAEYIEAFKENFDRKPTINMIIDFIDRHSHNLLLEDDDADLKLGYGMLIMPEKYHFEEITFTFPQGKSNSLDTVKIKKDGYIEGKKLDTVATIIGERTYLPVRQLAELLGIDIEWNDKTREVIIRKQQGDH